MPSGNNILSRRVKPVKLSVPLCYIDLVDVSGWCQVAPKVAWQHTNAPELQQQVRVVITMKHDNEMKNKIHNKCLNNLEIS